MYIRTVLISLIAIIAAFPAHAWSEREQGMLAGATAAYLINSLSKNNQERKWIDNSPREPYADIDITVIQQSPAYKIIDVYIPECQCYKSFLVRIR